MSELPHISQEEIDIEEKLEQIKEEKPELYAQLLELASSQKEKEETEQEKVNKVQKPFIHVFAYCCPFCYSIREDNTYMEYRRRLGGYIRVRNARKEEMETLEIRYNVISTSVRKSCNLCRETLELLPKNEIINRFLQSSEEWEKKQRDLMNEYRKEKGLDRE